MTMHVLAASCETFLASPEAVTLPSANIKGTLQSQGKVRKEQE